MSETQGEGPGELENTFGDIHLEQIEYLIYQGTQGHHFIFEKPDIVRVLSQPTDESDFFTLETMEKVQSLLSELLDRTSIDEKRSFLERLGREEYELLLRAYFHLVENTILSHSKLRH
jgi:hypothetical protein